MVGIAADKRGVGGAHVEADAGVVLVGGVRPERVDVREEIAAGAHADADLAVSDAHVGERVVVGVEDDADGAGPAVAGDVHVADVAVGRAVVRAALNLQAIPDVLHRDVLDAGLAPGLDADPGRAAGAVEDAAAESIDASGRPYVVGRMDAAEAHERLALRKVRSGPEDGEVGKGERDGELRLRRRGDRMRKQVDAVGDGNRVVGACVNERLERVGAVLAGCGGEDDVAATRRDAAGKRGRQHRGETCGVEFHGRA